MNKLKTFLYKFWNSEGRRVVHTFWQSFLAVFILGATGILSNVLNTHNLADAKSALVALVVAAAAAGLAAIKAAYVSQKNGTA